MVARFFGACTFSNNMALQWKRKQIKAVPMLYVFQLCSSVPIFDYRQMHHKSQLFAIAHFCYMFTRLSVVVAVWC